MGTGKTSVGEPLARRLGRPFVDNDRVLEAIAGATAREVAQREGIDALHRLEATMLRAALDREEPSVVAAAASVVDDEGIRDALREHVVVWIDADLEDLAAKVGRKPHRPYPDRDPVELVAELHARRAPWYRELAAVVVRRDPARDDEDLAAAIAAALVPRLGH
jgi:shikimate kinase